MTGVKLGDPAGSQLPTSAFRSTTCNLESTTLKYRSGTFLLGSTNVKHEILTVRWIQCQYSTDDENIKYIHGIQRPIGLHPFTRCDDDVM